MAHECVQFLRNQLIGVATFLPLDSLRPKEVPERLRSLHPGAHLAIDLVAVDDPRVRVALEYACGDTIVCDSLELARQLAFGAGERIKGTFDLVSFLIVLTDVAPFFQRSHSTVRRSKRAVL